MKNTSHFNFSQKTEKRRDEKNTNTKKNTGVVEKEHKSLIEQVPSKE